MHKKSFSGRLAVANKVLQNRTRSQCQRQKPKAPNRHHVHFGIDVFIEQVGQIFCENDYDDAEQKVYQTEFLEHYAHDVAHGHSVFVAKADAHNHSRDGHHSRGNAPNQSHKAVGRAKSRKPRRSDKSRKQIVHDQTANRLIAV